MLNKMYVVLAALVLCVYAGAATSGWEWGSPERNPVPADVRRSPGWSRTGTSHFWYSGYRGGK